MGTIYLLVDHDANRKRLAEQLTETHNLVEPTDEPLSEASFELCIVDGAAFERLYDDLRARKREEAPVFLPYLLLTSERVGGDLPAAVWEVVDEVISTPIEPAKLEQRIDNLLRRRRLSVTLKRRQERSEERFRSLFKAAPDPVIVTNAEGEISGVNDAFSESFGLTGDRVIGRNISELDVTPPEAIERVLLRVGDNDEEQPRELVEWPLANDRLITELSADAVVELGEVTDRIGIFRDVTPLKEREEMLERQNERLQEFASTIAHDLRNPLNIAQGYLDVARETGDEEYFDAIEGAHQRMEELLGEVLTLAHLGQTVLEPTPVDLEAAARRAWEHVYTAEATLEVTADARILADENRLSELLENLFRNAVDHGGAAVTVDVGQIDREGFFVADDGPGIPQGDWDDVFEAGYTTTEEGTGFGLSIVRQIVDGHDWAIAVAEADSGGARFEISDVDFPGQPNDE